MNEGAKHQPVVNGSQVIAAGLASTTAAVITSRFGVAGTLIGAALTSMIITGGSAILKAYLESVSGTVRKMPGTVKAKANRVRAGRVEEPMTLPGRPDLRENFMGRMRAAMGWFSHLPTMRRRSIMLKGFIAAAVAFVIGMTAVYAVESGIGNSLSCGFWSECPSGAVAGPHIISGRGTGASSSVTLSRPQTPTAVPQDQSVDPSLQDSGTPAVDPSVDPAAPAQDPAASPETPTETPAETPQAPAPSGADGTPAP